MGGPLRALPGPAGALLLERLPAAAGHLGPGLGALGPGPGRGQLGGDDLVQHRHVGLDAEEVGVEGPGPGGRAVRPVHVDPRRVDGCRPSLASLDGVADEHQAAAGPGHGALEQQQVCARRRPGRPRRLRVVTRSPPIWPAIRVPLNTRAGVAQAPMEPGARWCLWLPWLAPWPLKLWRFIAPAKPLPLLTAVTSTLSPALSRSTVELLADL